MTISGVRKVFQRFDEVEVGVGTHQTPAMTMNVLTQTFADLIKDPKSRLRFNEQFAADFSQFDPGPGLVARAYNGRGRLVRRHQALTQRQAQRTIRVQRHSSRCCTRGEPALQQASARP